MQERRADEFRVEERGGATGGAVGHGRRHRRRRRRGGNRGEEQEEAAARGQVEWHLQAVSLCACPRREARASLVVSLCAREVFVPFISFLPRGVLRI